MQLHLVLPGLLWPAKVLHDCAHDLELPALSRLLGRGRPSWYEPLALEAWLCKTLLASDAPIAALRLLGEGMDPGDGYWLCADPCHLAIEQGRLSLGSQEPNVDDQELQDLLAVVLPLVRELPGFVELRAGSHGRAYLRLSAAPEMSTTPPSAAIGYGLESVLPRGGEARSWIALGNELQMSLHALPGNRKREAEARAALNHIWFWGGGRLPPPRSSPYTHMLGDGALMQGLARWSSTASQVLPARFEPLPHGAATLACITALAIPTRTLDVTNWRAALLALERDWFAPLAAAHASGSLKSLRITALGPELSLDLELAALDRFRFWTKAIPLAGLTP